MAGRSLVTAAVFRCRSAHFLVRPGTDLTLLANKNVRGPFTRPAGSNKAQNIQDSFSLIELIGVLAIIVIVASLLLPRVLNPQKAAQIVQGVNRARIQEALAGIRAVKTATAEHYARFGSLASRNGVAVPVSGTFDNYDAILLSEQLLDRPFSPPLGAKATVRLRSNPGRSASNQTGSFAGGYDLDGLGRNSIAGAAYLVEAVISGVTEAEAKALNDGLDGMALGAGPGEDDRRGSVTYERTGAGELREVHIYITHH